MDILKYVMELINNGLFPIACCGGLVYIITILFKAYREDTTKMSESFTKALDKNTNAITRLCERLGGKDDQFVNKLHVVITE